MFKSTPKSELSTIKAQIESSVMVMAQLLKFDGIEECIDEEESLQEKMTQWLFVHPEQVSPLLSFFNRQVHLHMGIGPKQYDSFRVSVCAGVQALIDEEAALNNWDENYYVSRPMAA